MVTDRYDQYSFPIGIQVDIEKIKDSIITLFEKLSIERNFFINELNTLTATTMNLSHLPHLEGNDRWKVLRGDHLSVIKHNVKEEDFVTFLSELNGLYLKDIIDNVFDYHLNTFGTEFKGRCQLIWLRPGHCYKMHVDDHTAHRYHIPIITDENCFFIFKKDDEIIPVHMPANGNVWYLNPKDVKHTVAHCGSKIRLHVLLTSGK